MLRRRKMDHTGQSTGSRRSQKLKMAASKEMLGLHLQGISETGEITARKASVSSSIRMETSTKECGLWIRSMAKVLTGESMGKSLEESTLETGLRIRNTGVVLSFSKIAIDTMVTG
jgi:hypothetical protein